MEVQNYIPVFVQIVLAIGLGGVILIASHLLGQRASGGIIKDRAYECGLVGEGEIHPRFSVKFYMTAMLFIIFDIEVVFLIPWAMIYREFIKGGVSILGPILFFLGLLIVGIVYEIKKGALEWEN